jgi:hypothetical protein
MSEFEDTNVGDLDGAGYLWVTETDGHGDTVSVLVHASEAGLVWDYLNTREPLTCEDPDCGRAQSATYDSDADAQRTRQGTYNVRPQCGDCRHYRHAEAQDAARFEEMAYGPQDDLY